MTISLFLILDSVGNITDFLNLIRDMSTERQKRIIFREMIFALIIMVVFSYFGEFLLLSLDVGPATVQIAGGLVLFLIAIKMVFPSEQRLYTSLDKSEPYIVPIATPMIAGPSALAAIMFYTYSEQAHLTVLSSILVAWAASVIVLWLAYRFRNRVSPKILTALEKLMGLVLTLMSVEMFLKGLKIFINSSQI